MENLAYSVLSTNGQETQCVSSVTPKHELASFLLTLAFGFIPAPAQAVLSQGNRCTAVSDLQNALWNKGMDPGNVDGVFGTRTRLAVQKFQYTLGLTLDGVVGSETAVALGLDPNIQCTSSALPRQAPVDTWSNIAWVSTWGGPLNVRAQPNRNALVIASIPNGTKVTLDSGTTGGWVKRKEGGWITTTWLKFTPLVNRNGGCQCSKLPVPAPPPPP
jgi:hypothetical protein